jgi:hypothetical protein
MYQDALYSPLLLFNAATDPPTSTIIADGSGQLSCIALKDVGDFVCAMVTDPDTGKSRNRVGFLSLFSTKRIDLES